MSFLNALLLGGMLASFAPLVIHLLNRSRFQSLDWGAMHLLDAALETNSRRIEWEHWLLLFLRCLIPALFAFALARPVLSGNQLGSLTDGASIQMVLDDTLSMGTLLRSPGSNVDAPVDANFSNTGNSSSNQRNEIETRFDAAKTAISELLRQFPRAEWSLGTSSNPPRDVLAGSVISPTRVQAGLSTLEPQAGKEAWLRSVEQAVSQLQSMNQPARHLVLVSDFQRSSFENQAIREQLAKMLDNSARDARPIQVVLLPVGPSADQPANISVQINVLEEQRVLPEQPFAVRARVSNHGTATAEGVRVEFLVDDQPLSSRTVNVAAGTVEEMLFGCQLVDPGSHHLQARIVGGTADDWLDADDTSSCSVTVQPQHKIALLDGAAENASLERAIREGSGYLSLALAPFTDEAGTGGDVRNRYLLQPLSPDQLTQKPLDAFSAVVLVDVPRLSNEAVDQLVQFTRGGGGVWLVPGSRTDLDWYNNTLHEQAGFQPLLYSTAVEASDERVPPNLLAPNESSPLAGLRDAFGDSVDVQLKRWTPMISPASLQDDDASSVQGLVELADGSPLLAGRPFGEGYVVQSSIGYTEEWSNLPLRPIFVPLMQAAMDFAIDRNQPTYLYASGDAVALRQRTPRSDNQSQGLFEVIHPNGERSPIDLKPSASFEDTSRPGYYRVAKGDSGATERFSTSATTTRAMPAIEPAGFAIQAEPNESKLQSLSAEELDELASALGGSVAGSTSQLARELHALSHGREMWKWFVVGLLVILFAELLLAQRIVRGNL